tara:strand:- start:6240 stop:6635 length:396 start_codon:yes stop_codon:yes gene_type:complete
MSGDELIWCPIEGETNSASVLMIHVLGAERFRIHQIAGGIDVNRDRESEFVPSSVTLDNLLDYLKEVDADTQKVFESLSSSALDKIVPAVRSYEKDEPVRWHVLHTVEHFGIHIGHLSLNRQLYLACHDNA